MNVPNAPGECSVPDAADPQPSRFAWSASQRRALLVLLSLLCAGLGLRYACTPAYVSDPQPERPARYAELADRIDPNTADVHLLAALPQLGDKRARAVIEHREKQAARRPGEVVFRTAEDLTVVPGIGWATVETLRPYLIFPPRPETRPAPPR